MSETKEWFSGQVVEMAPYRMRKKRADVALEALTVGLLGWAFMMCALSMVWGAFWRKR